MNTELTVKNKVGRPKGKTINFEGISELWKTHSNKQLAEKYGTSIPNIWVHRDNAAKKGVDSVFVKVKKVKSVEEIVAVLNFVYRRL